MSKFCSECGKELVDGKCPNCDNAEVKEVEKIEKEKAQKVIEEKSNVGEETSEIGKKVAEYFKLFLNTAKGMFKNPEKTLKEKNIDWIVASVVMVINSILFGVAVKVIFEKMLSGAAFSVMSKVSNGIAGMFGQELTSISDISKTAGIGFAINSILIFVIVWLMHEILFKKKLNIKNLITMEGKCQCLFTIELLITIIVAYLSVGLAVLLLPIFVISCLVNVHFGIIAISKINEDQTLYVVTLSNLFPVISIAVGAVALIVLQMSTSSFNNIF